MNSKFLETLDYFMVGKNDEMREKSEDFFKFFTRFLDDVFKQLPKPQPKPKGKKGAAAKKAPSGHAAMMAELMAKQAANKK